MFGVWVMGKLAQRRAKIVERVLRQSWNIHNLHQLCELQTTMVKLDDDVQTYFGANDISLMLGHEKRMIT
jgi:hypothetical protein